MNVDRLTLSLYRSASFTQPRHSSCHLRPPQQNGFALVTVIVIVLIAGVLLSGTVNTTRETERTAGNAIQYSRAMEAAEGGAVVAQNALIDKIGERIFADDSASEGVFSLDSLVEKWWTKPDYQGQHIVDDGLMLGVANQPRYAYEQIGEYISDGGTGVVNMDIGGAAYGRTSSGAREHILFKVESYGVGSKTDVSRAVETVVIVTK